MFFFSDTDRQGENTHKNIPETIAQAQREKRYEFKPRSSLNVNEKAMRVRERSFKIVSPRWI